MIQEIEQFYDVVYRPAAVPVSGDRAVYLREGKICLLERDEKLYFPLCTGEEAGRYLFSIGEHRWFLPEGEAPAEGGWYTRRDIRRRLPRETVFAALTACQFGAWYAANRFCGKCGTETVHDEKERMLRCPRCGNMIFPKICPAVIVAVTRGDRLLLTRYAGRPQVGWALVAGFCEVGESVEDTVRREVLEEVGLHVTDLRYYRSQPWSMTDTLLMGFWCRAEEETVTLADGELSVAQWTKREEIPVEFDNISLTNEMVCRFKAGKELEPWTK